MVLIPLKQKDIKVIKEKWHAEQNNICPLFGKEYSSEDVTLDHCHKLKSELPSEDGKGLCRGAIHFQANAIEGKITNAFKRYGGDKHTDMVTFLRNLANYLERNKSHEEIKYIHPSEVPKAPKLMKSSYNKLLKAAKGTKVKVPAYSGKFTKPIQKLFEKYNITPEFHS